MEGGGGGFLTGGGWGLYIDGGGGGFRGAGCASAVAGRLATTTIAPVSARSPRTRSLCAGSFDFTCPPFRWLHSGTASCRAVSPISGSLVGGALAGPGQWPEDATM